MNRRFIIRMRPTTYHRAKRCGDTRERVCVELVISVQYTYNYQLHN